MLFINFTGPNRILCYSKEKIWIFPVILNPFPAPYDKNSSLYLLAKFVKEWDFGEIWCILSIYQNLISWQTLRGATGTSFCRMELGRDSKSPKRSILFVLTKPIDVPNHEDKVSWLLPFSPRSFLKWPLKILLRMTLFFTFSSTFSNFRTVNENVLRQFKIIVLSLRFALPSSLALIIYSRSWAVEAK